MSSALHGKRVGNVSINSKRLKKAKPPACQGKKGRVVIGQTFTAGKEGLAGKGEIYGKGRKVPLMKKNAQTKGGIRREHGIRGGRLSWDCAVKKLLFGWRDKKGGTRDLTEPLL